MQQKENVRHKTISLVDFESEPKTYIDKMSVLGPFDSPTNPLEELDFLASIRNNSGVIRLPQLFRGIEIYGAEVAYKMKNGEIISRFGRLSFPSLKSIKPAYSKEEALKKIHDIFGKERDFSISLKIYPAEGKDYLVWHIEEKGFASQWNFFFDAVEGEFIDSFNALAHGAGELSSGESVEVESSEVEGKYVLEVSGRGARKTYDAKNEGGVFGGFVYGLPGELGESLDDEWNDPVIVDAHYYAGEFSKLLSDRFNRDSFDGKGTPIISTVHFSKKFINAFWNGRQMVYGDGGTVKDEDGNPLFKVEPLSGALDVVAHEISHAITTSSSKLAYRNESGALNEAFSDMMAAYAEFVIQADKADWMLGEDIWDIENKETALRYMNNPTQDKRSKDYYPERYQGRKDNGGVHINSGIANLAFYLLVEGGSHPRIENEIEVTSIGLEKAMEIVYLAFTEKLVSSSTFLDAKNAMLAVAEELNESDEVFQAIKDAWDAVGVINE